MSRTQACCGLNPMCFISLTISPKTPADARRLALGVRRLALEDRTLSVDVDDDTGIATIAAVSEFHLDVVLDRLRQEFDVDARLGVPHVLYEESDGIRSEPIMRLAIDVPPVHIDEIAQNVVRRRGRILSIQDCDAVFAIVARVPLAELFGYQLYLRELTQGRAAYRIDFECYEPCLVDPGPDSDAIVGAPRRPAPSPLASGIALPEPEPDDRDDEAGDGRVVSR